MQWWMFCGNAQFPQSFGCLQNFPTRKLGKILIFYNMIFRQNYCFSNQAVLKRVLLLSLLLSKKTKQAL